MRRYNQNDTVNYFNNTIRSNTLQVWPNLPRALALRNTEFKSTNVQYLDILTCLLLALSLWIFNHSLPVGESFSGQVTVELSVGY